jgi:hypothetical protein
VHNTDDRSLVPPFCKLGGTQFFAWPSPPCLFQAIVPFFLIVIVIIIMVVIVVVVIIIIAIVSDLA